MPEENILDPTPLEEIPVPPTGLPTLNIRTKKPADGKTGTLSAVVPPRAFDAESLFHPEKR